MSYKRKVIDGVDCYGKLKPGYEITVEHVNTDGFLREFVWCQDRSDGPELKWTQLVKNVLWWAEARRIDKSTIEIWTSPFPSRGKYVESGDQRTIQEEELPLDEYEFITSF
tara:strand:+ start:250 stop:582 length:333 start_codon:yes stop_codon:yes gene_type:complete